MGLSWQQGPLSPTALGRFLTPEPLPERRDARRAERTVAQAVVGHGAGEDDGALRIALRAGTVWVNMYGGLDPYSTFSGRGLSGYGYELGPESIGEYTAVKTIKSAT